MASLTFICSRFLSSRGVSKPIAYISRNLSYDRRRGLQTSTRPKKSDFAFAFDIDGVLLRASDPIPGAHEALSYLQSQNIPFIFLTNGGGKHEADRVEELSKRLGVPLDTSMFVQSHTPFADLDQYKDKTILVVGGQDDKCRRVAETYGFKSVVIPGDIMVGHPSIWPLSEQFLEYYRPFSRPLPKPISTNPSESLKIDAIFVYNDSRDWGLDTTIILDLLLSEQGIMGTLSPKNGNPDLANRGYLQDGQPPLYYSNPDLWWVAKFHLSRLGQGAFREALEGLWTAVTGGQQNSVILEKTLIGKPYYLTYEFAEKKLIQHRKTLLTSPNTTPLRQVYMIGDNPESDIRGGNSFMSPFGTSWSTILVKSGVYTGGDPAYEPAIITKNVYEAVKWGLAREKWSNDL